VPDEPLTREQAYHMTVVLCDLVARGVSVTVMEGGLQLKTEAQVRAYMAEFSERERRRREVTQSLHPPQRKRWK